jgi:predicted alpha/beta-fold hydrolase
VAMSVLGQAASAEVYNPNYPDFQAIESDNIKIMSYADCSADYFQSELDRMEATFAALAGSKSDLTPLSFAWVPTATPTRLEDPRCSPEVLKELVNSNRASTANQSTALTEFFQRCDMALSWGAPSGAKSVFNLTQVKYEYCENPFIRKVIIKMPNGDRVRGVLGLKPGSAPRPLVIAKCGVLCNAGDPGMRFMIMHLFDESPFNLLVLANSTGADFVRDNRFFIPGGFTEGQHLIYAAEIMQQSALRNRISSIHAAGFSLGGHASLYASYLNGFRGDENGEPYFSSVLASCPVVDLEPAIQDLFKYDIRGTIAQVLFKHSIDKVLSTNPELAPLFDWWKAPREERPDLVAEQAAHYLQKLPKGWALPPFSKVNVQNRRDFWNVNRFQTLAFDNRIQTPTLAIAALDDEVVDTEKNLKKLRNGDIATALVPRGDHCAFNQVYGWRTASSLFRNYILSHSHEFLEQARTTSTRLPQTFKATFRAANLASPDQNPTDLHGVTRFRFHPGADSLEVTQQFFIGNTNNECGHENPHYAPLRCYREVVTKLPFKSFTGRRPAWAYIPTAASEAEALSRWANTNLKLTDDRGQVVDDTTLQATRIKWTAYTDTF